MSLPRFPGHHHEAEPALAALFAASRDSKARSRVIVAGARTQRRTSRGLRMQAALRWQQVSPATPYPWALSSVHVALGLSGLTPDELWVSYVGLGGNRNASDLDGHLRGQLAWPDIDRLQLASALDETLDGLGIYYRVLI